MSWESRLLSIVYDNYRFPPTDNMNFNAQQNIENNLGLVSAHYRRNERDIINAVSNFLYELYEDNTSNIRNWNNFSTIGDFLTFVANNRYNGSQEFGNFVELLNLYNSLARANGLVEIVLPEPESELELNGFGYNPFYRHDYNDGYNYNYNGFIPGLSAGYNHFYNNFGDTYYDYSDSDEY